MGNAAVTCCTKRTLSLQVCRNDRLMAYLDHLDKESKTFDALYLYLEEDSVSGQYILCYHRLERDEDDPSLRKRHILRLDWGRDGLCFQELDAKLADDMMVRSKTFDPALKAGDVRKHLAEVAMRVFDTQWSSMEFCEFLFEKAPGQKFEYS
mmetsp:Transcript_59132/g.157350  ORF Transcript_59132/g.157350 Transcript_59132/m.157350 type:complete len:152 (-) Transcript_59132:226-681(-)